MQYCTIIIATTVDGKQTTAKYQGEMQVSSSSVLLAYTEENAKVSLSLSSAHGEIMREGDYSLKLPLRTGETLQGWIGVNGSQGEVGVFTDKITFSTSENGVLAQLHYTLIFGQERQVMRLRIHATAHDKKEQ